MHATHPLNHRLPRLPSHIFSSSFLLGFLIAGVILISIFYLLYSNKMATSGYAIRNLQTEHSKLISELEKWNGINIKNDVIANMENGYFTDTMYRPTTITEIRPTK